MDRMITTASDFQYSVNIQYDLNNSKKLQNFIPTPSSMRLLDDILQSTEKTSSKRSRILIGAYGKGKSHIVLTILSLLRKHLPITDFVHLNKKLELFPQIKRRIENYYEDSKLPLLPVLITGNGTSLTQSFILALQYTLKENNLLDIMPETNYYAAVKVIKKWQSDYPDTFYRFSNLIEDDIDTFISQLESFDITAYKQFEDLYPELTSGSKFNPFLGFDVVELYESVVKELRKRQLYAGIYVVYDEFSKYLESNIIHASVSDTKMLQDFAEKCSRSAENQLHILLISHKEISNYIDTLPKEKLDGWRGISERFEHILLNNNFTQIYEIIASVIKKEPHLWEHFTDKNKDKFENIIKIYQKHDLFKELTEQEFKNAIYGCYPLHPVSMFILPRLSERIAQNERTLFTFLSSNGGSTLPDFLLSHDDTVFDIVTPDVIYDYFEALFRKEMYADSLYNTYVLSQKIIAKLMPNSLETKIIKTIALIYILEQYEKLKPLREEIIQIYSISYLTEDIEKALKNLIEKEYVLYLRQSNSFLKLKESSGVDIKQSIENEVNKQRTSVVVKKILNTNNNTPYLYPYRYNDTKEMTRFFKFTFIDDSEISSDTDWSIKSEKIQADGVIYGVIAHPEMEIPQLKDILKESSKNHSSVLFVLLKEKHNIEQQIRECSAVQSLIQKVSYDSVLQDEYRIIYDDLLDILNDYIDAFIKPENKKSIYIYNGEIKELHRKSQLTSLLSEICELLYPDSPIIKNEAINKNETTSITSKNRDKIVTALLRNELEPNLGLVGYGPDVSIMRSTLICSHILTTDNITTEINLSLQDDPANLTPLLSTIEQFIISAKENRIVQFSQLYENLRNKKNKIGARKGIIPIYLACILRKYKKQLSITVDGKQYPINAFTLSEINDNPQIFSLEFIEWNSDIEKYTSALENLFADYVFYDEKDGLSYNYIGFAMQRWFMSLPKFTKEIKKNLDETPIDRNKLQFLKSIRSIQNTSNLLFNQIKLLFEEENCDHNLVEKVRETKTFFDNILYELQNFLIEKTKEIFYLKTSRVSLDVSLTLIITTWLNSLSSDIFEHLFSNGTEKFLLLCKNENKNERTFISALAQSTTGLRLEDWNEKTIEVFLERLHEYKETAENYIPHNISQNLESNPSYELRITMDDGQQIIKRFDKISETVRGKLLHNKILSELEAMGLSISEQEKRQVLINILKDLC